MPPPICPVANSSCQSFVILDFPDQITNIDHLLGLLKQALAPRFDLTVVIMAANESERFANHFRVPPVVNLYKPKFSVEIEYLPEQITDYCGAAVDIVKHIHTQLGPGDILVFLACAPQVDRVVARLRLDIPGLQTVPLHDRMSKDEREKVLGSRGEERRCVVNTNIAESSVTVDGISYVIGKSIDLLIGVEKLIFAVDCGVQMDPTYNPRVRLETFRATLIARPSADQRAACAGRTQPGTCFRLYTEETYNIFLPRWPSTPKRTDSLRTGMLALRIRKADIEFVSTFDYIDPANEKIYFHGLMNLRAM